MKLLPWITIGLALVAPVADRASGQASRSEGDDWIATSDADTRVLLEVMARFNPEAIGAVGVDGLDRLVTRLPRDRTRKQIEAMTGAIGALELRLAEETDPRVRLDLEILIDSARRNVDGIRLNESLLLPYVNVAQLVRTRGEREAHEFLVEPVAGPDQNLRNPGTALAD